MSESKTITVPRDMLLAERISEVASQLSEWLESLDKPFNVATDRLQLTKYEKNDKEYSYHYSMISREELSAADVST
jgi:hypothetical protein